MARALFLAIVVFLLACARIAGADDRLHLELESTEGARACGSSEVLRAKIAERLGRDPFTDDASAPLRLRIAFARSRRAWTADIALVDAEGKRVGARLLDHQGATCDPLVASVVFTVAVLLEDLAPRPTPPPASPPSEPEPPPPPPPPPPPLEQKPQPQPGPRVRLDAALAAAGALGTAPAPTVGGEAIVGVDVSRLRVELSGRAHLPASAEGDIAVRTRLVYGRLAPCYGWKVASACGVIALGSISGEAIGVGVERSSHESRFYAAAGIGALSRLFIVDDLVFLRASIDLLFSLARAGFDVGGRRVWTVPAASLTGALGVGVRLP